MTVSLIRGPIFTSDPSGLWAEAMVVRDGEVAFVGGADEAVALAGTEVEVVEVGDGATQ